jgi:adenylate kinase
VTRAATRPAAGTRTADAAPLQAGSAGSRPAGNGRKNGKQVKPRRILVMLGAPGAGKGTQADILSERLGLPKVSSGDLFRSAVKDASPLGREVKRYLDRGALAPDELTVRMIKQRLLQPDAEAGAILDGFPRTVPQAEALDRMLESQGSRVTGALYIEVDKDELVRRLAGRRVCTGPSQHVYHVDYKPPAVPGVCDVDGTPLEQRADDRPETIRSRLEKQLPPMYEVVDHYAERGQLFPVRGDQSIDEVTDALLHAVDTASKVRG